MASSKRWNIIGGSNATDLKALLLANRGVGGSEESAFFNPTLEHIPDPFLFDEMDKALERVQEAIGNEERIVIFGDYDVDGITGTAILVRTLLKLGAQVSYRLPHRVHDGYGLKNHLIDEMATKDVKLIITVDNGISAANEIAYAKDLGIDVIVTDHHSIPPVIPEAAAILHPKVEGESYPFKDLSGSGVAFVFARALLEAGDVEDAEQFWLEMIDLAALGTVADCVPLTGANRAIVKEGLRQIGRTAFPGLRHLLDTAGWKRDRADTETIGFVIGPRLNAAGRMDTPLDALHLFLYDSERSRLVAEKLNRLNGERQVETENIASRVAQALETDPPRGIVLAEGDYHVGIIGIVAARMVEKFGLPAIIMGRKGDELVGSCRSNGRVNMIEALRHFPHRFTHFGGHEAAAGFSMPADQYPALKEELESHIASLEDREEGIAIDIDAALEAGHIGPEIYGLVESLAPFGVGNSKPIFALEQAVVMESKPVGSGSTHLKMMVKKDGKTFDAIAFRHGHRLDEVPAGSVIDLAFTLEKNEFNGSSKLGLNVIDLRSSEG